MVKGDEKKREKGITGVLKLFCSPCLSGRKLSFHRVY